MVLGNGTIIPFQLGDIKKLIEINVCTLVDLKDAVSAAFEVHNFKLYNRKIGFEIPDYFLIPYLDQRKDYTDFVIEVISIDNVCGRQSVTAAICNENIPTRVIENISSRILSANINEATCATNENSSRHYRLNKPDVKSCTKDKEGGSCNDLQNIMDEHGPNRPSKNIDYHSCTKNEEKNPEKNLQNIANENGSSQPHDSLDKNPCTTGKEGDSGDHLQDILATPQGWELCKYFGKNNKLDDIQRTFLSQQIAIHEINNIVKSDAPLVMSPERFTHLANAIANRFPSENAATYYKNLDYTIIQKGELFDAFNSEKCRYLRKLANFRYKQCGKDIDTDFPELDELYENKRNFCKYSQLWQETHDLRMTYIQLYDDPFTYFKKFLLGTTYNGQTLIEYDFECFPGNTKRTLWRSWDKIAAKIFKEILERDDIISMMIELYENHDELFSIMILSFLLQPYGPFKKDSLRNLITHIDTSTGDPKYELMHYYTGQKPRAFVTGRKGQKLSYFVVLNKHVYSMKYCLEAVTFCLKCYHALDLPFIEEQIEAWTFLEQAFFDIHDRELNPLHKPLLERLKG